MAHTETEDQRALASAPAAGLNVEVIENGKAKRPAVTGNLKSGRLSGSPTLAVASRAWKNYSGGMPLQDCLAYGFRRERVALHGLY